MDTEKPKELQKRDITSMTKHYVIAKGFRIRFPRPPSPPAKIEVEIDRGELYKCRISGLNFRGCCPVIACHANISNVHPSNCLYLRYGEKEEFDRLDVAYAMEISDKRSKDLLISGRSKAYCAILLYNILMRLRANSNVDRNCSKCGVIRTSFGDCLNVVECDNRIDFSNRFIANSYLSFPEMRIKKEDLFLLLENKGKIVEFVEENNKQVSRTNLVELFGTTKLLMDEACEIRAKV